MKYHVVASYDTETANLDDGTAIPVLYQLNRFADIDLSEYKPGCDGEVITFDRFEQDILDRFEDIIQDGKRDKYVPVIAAYNLYFDIKTVMCTLNQRYHIKVLAKSSKDFYCVDLYDAASGLDRDDVDPVLRFWDSSFLEQGGLDVMGELAGLAKLKGDWDYSLIRTPYTELTEEELGYAARDVQVIPAYLRYLLRTNPWMKPEELGNHILTKTGIVRALAKNSIGGSMKYWYSLDCDKELPPDYRSYSLRKACLRGGLTFTAATYAHQDITRVLSLDVTSMHHTFINGMLVPYEFERKNRTILAIMVADTVQLSYRQMLLEYHRPFQYAYHVRVRISGLRMREDSCFKEWGIGIIPEGKFADKLSADAGIDIGDANRLSEETQRKRGYHDTCVNGVFAFSKLMEAKQCDLYVNEIEMWNLAQVYEWDELQVMGGEATEKWRRPPDYVTLQSQMLYKVKQNVKAMLKEYKTGMPYDGEIPDSIPEAFRDGMRDGSLDWNELQSYYTGTVKGSFNGIYGTQAQDEFKPDYLVEETGDVVVDRDTLVCKENFDDRKPEHSTVWFNYGMRIVGRSRMHLVIAMMLLWKKFNGAVYVTGGDTDSLKCHVPESVSEDELSRVLGIMQTASKNAISRCLAHVRHDARFTEYTSDLEGVGGFVIENPGHPYEHHVELWNKGRVSYYDGEFHVTLAGVSRPPNEYNVEKILKDFERGGASPYDAIRNTLGYNVTLNPEVTFALMPSEPPMDAEVDREVCDYQNHTYRVQSHQAVHLKSCSKELGNSDKVCNNESINWLIAHGKDPLTTARAVQVKQGIAQVVSLFPLPGESNVMMRGVR